MANRYKFIIFSILLLLLFVADILLGSLRIDFATVLGYEDSIARTIIMDFRLPKALVSLLVGVALSVSGLLMQTIFRNPLAGPYVLGVSSGASLGVAIFLLGAPLLGVGFAKDLSVVAAAWIGAAVILSLVMIISARLKDIMAVLILGMMFSSAASAFVDILQFFSNDTALKGFVIWSMGSMGGLSTAQLWILALSVLAGMVLSVAVIKPLNLLLLGENYARSMGLNVSSTRAIVFIATSLLAGSVTAFCGPIAFLGIAVPHVARMIFREANHRILLPASALLGACAMLMCDIIAGMPGSDMVLPINTVTALLGIPIVVLVVVRGHRNKIM